jgi:acyl-CoA synthetase (NDP forming)
MPAKTAPSGDPTSFGLPTQRVDVDQVLTEVESLELLDSVGIGTVGRTHAGSEVEDVLSAARTLGYPVVIKGVVEGMAHKSEHGLVAVQLEHDDEVRAAVERMAASVGDEPITFMAQQFNPGFELILGMTRCEFGPLIVVGLGGVAVEILRDSVCALAPVDERQARDMISRLNGVDLLRGHRGKPAVDEDSVVDVIVKLSALALSTPTLRELDINPLLVTATGATAVDASAVMSSDASEFPEAPGRNPDPETLARLFAPRGVAVIGAKPGAWNRGLTWMRQIRAAGYAGPISAVSRRDAVDDWPTYATVADVPAPVDLVLAAVSERALPAVLDDCVAANVPWVSVFATGFGDNGDEVSATGSVAMREVLAGTRTHVIGPGALGSFSPTSGLVADGVADRRGSVGVISQSGGFVTTVSKVVAEKGLGISKAVSYGQEGDVTVDTLLDFFAADEDTEVVCLYLEGLSAPQKFRDSIERLCSKKPVVLLRGGTTSQGARAAVSHTGALAGSAEGWEALARATGLTVAQNFEDLISTVIAFLTIKAPFDHRASFVTLSGRAAVTFTDELIRHGFDVPPISVDIGSELRALMPPGTSTKNPIDMASGYFRPDVLGPVLNALASDEAFSVVMLHFPMETISNLIEYAPQAIPPFIETVLKGAAAAAANNRPFVVVLPHTILDAERAVYERTLLDAGIPSFDTIASLASAMSSVRTYRESAHEAVGTG